MHEQLANTHESNNLTQGTANSHTQKIEEKQTKNGKNEETCARDSELYDDDSDTEALNDEHEQEEQPDTSMDTTNGSTNNSQPDTATDANSEHTPPPNTTPVFPPTGWAIGWVKEPQLYANKYVICAFPSQETLTYRGKPPAGAALRLFPSAVQMPPWRYHNGN